MSEATFAAKLKQMRRDLASIVDRMNRDRSYDDAQLAQNALLAVSELDNPWFNELKWDWQPSDETREP